MRTCDIITGAAIAALLLLPTAAFAAGDAAKEIATAQVHADLAGTATDPNYTYMHLHHTLNCLVGPGGNGFDVKQMNPCAADGTGAIPDTSDPAKKKALEGLAARTRAAIANTDPAGAKKEAAGVAAALKAMK